LKGGNLRVEEVNDPAALDSLASAWRALAVRATEGGFFLGWEWTSTWLRHFRGARSIALLLVWDATQLVGMLPLLEERRGRPATRHLVGAVNNQTPRAGLLCDGDSGPVLRAVLEHLKATRRWVRLVLPLHEADSRLAAELPSAAAGLGLVTTPSRRSPLLRIGAGWDKYLESRSSQTRREWRRKRRRLEEGSSLRLRLVTEPGEARDAMADVLEIERHSWKQETGTSFTADTGVEGFYLELAEACAARGWLRLHLLYLDGQPVAHAIGVRYRSELLALKTSYDLRFAERSPGVAMMLTLIEQACAEGAAAVDLLGEETRWKAEMANDVRRCFDALVYTRGLPVCEMLALSELWLRPLVRRHTPWLLDVKRRLGRSE
jgi:CelD/BcsL family acetyltransferase involved in cellulose biosynthesis